ncbi:MAG: hypothetical protein LPK02_07060 [Rhodobacterales bacterium]|nr:hypothetical protein [Rhodobacterales bacterium]
MTQKMMTREEHWAEFKRLSVELVNIAFQIATAETQTLKQQRQWKWNMTRMKRLGHLKAAMELRA